MLVSLSIVPIAGDSKTSGELVEVLKIVDESGLPYQLTPSATCVEGGWDEVMSVVKNCHERVMEMAVQVVTTIQIEDERGATDKLTSNVRSLENKMGRKLERKHKS